VPEAGVGIGITVVVAVDCEAVLVVEEVPTGLVVVKLVVGSMLSVERLLDGTVTHAETANRSSTTIIAVISLTILGFSFPNQASRQTKGSASKLVSFISFLSCSFSGSVISR
jgi:hypothetical protein